MSQMLGLLFAGLVVLFFIVPQAAHYQRQATQQTAATATAEQAMVLTNAAQNYVENNYAILQTQVSGGLSSIPIAQLVSAGYLAGFQGENSYQQNWQLWLSAPTASSMEVLALSQGGTAIGDKDAPMIAGQAGAQCGFAPYPGDYGLPASVTANDAIGAFAGWQLPLPASINPGSGHIVCQLYFANGQLQTNVIYRHAVPGHPEYNAMSTTLNMAGNDIDDIDALNAQEVALGTANATAVTGSACSPNGAIAAIAPTASGQSTPGNVLNCVNGVWAAP